MDPAAPDKNLPVLVIMAAGMATRFLAGGKKRTAIKAFAEIGPGKEKLIDYILFDWKRVGGKEAVIVARKDTSWIFRRVLSRKYHGLTLSFAEQAIPEGRAKPKGTVDALLCGAAACTGRDMIVCNGDDVYGRSAFGTLLSHRDNDSLATLGYLMKSCVPREAKDGVSRAVMDADAQGNLISVKEYDNLAWEGDSLKDLKTKEAVNPGSFSSMNIIHLPSQLIAGIKGIDDEIPYASEEKMVALLGKDEFLIPKMLSMLPGKGIRCRVLPFPEGMPLGITRREDLGSVRALVIKRYPEGLAW